MAKSILTYAQFNKVVKNAERRGFDTSNKTTPQKEVYNALHGKYENVFEMKGEFMLVYGKERKEKFITNHLAKDIQENG
jgi:hypothetical protein